MAGFVLPSDPELAKSVVESRMRFHERWMEIGLIGLLFGSSREKQGNIVGATIITCVVLIVVVGFSSSENLPKSELLTLFGTIATLALGYTLGRQDK